MRERYERVSTFLPKFKNGDREAWSEIVSRFYDGLRFHTKILLMARGIHSVEVDDLIHRAFVRAWNQHERLLAESTFEFVSYLHVIINRLMLDELRNSRRIGPIPCGMDIPSPIETPSVLASWEEDMIRRQAMVAQLPDDDRKIYVLRAFKDKTIGEIGELMGKDKSTVSRRYAAILRSLHNE